jgi:hypothetical protein
VALDDTDVYWASAGDDTSANGSIWRAPRAGGTPYLITAGQDHPRAIALDTQYVYWLNDDLVGGGTRGSAVRVVK